MLIPALEDLLDAEALEFNELATETQAMIAMLSPSDPHRKDAAAALLRMLEDADPTARNLRFVYFMKYLLHFQIGHFLNRTVSFLRQFL